MTTKQILQLDCRNVANQKVIQKVLRQIKPLSRYSVEEKVPFEAIEKAVNVMSKNYPMRVREFSADPMSNRKDTIWQASLIDEKTLEEIGIAYGLSIYEVFAKTAILMYSKVKSGMKRREEG